MKRGLSPVTRGDLLLRRDRIIGGKHEGSITVERGGTLTLDGMVTGPISVRSGGAGKIRGLAGTVTVEEGGLLLVSGTVAATLYLHPGSRAEISGTVGVLVGDPSAMLVTSPGAKIAGRMVA